MTTKSHIRIAILAHNIRSTYNVGSILRTADCFGVSEVILSGYTPYPALPGDTRLPHLSRKQTTQIAKTALGAEATLAIARYESISEALVHIRAAHYQIAALEQNPNAIALSRFEPQRDICLVLGNEVQGVEDALLQQSDVVIEIPQYGTKESLNVSCATAIALYGIRHPAVIAQ